ncbi:hypothetical protein BOW52_04060 [Solemya elarraichensis gill symbiont]|uniref:Uncharacterized protein n=1 Tax=Solemya elarraichensis gill symbiont TaxID=1918949 RepID=A0A1T2LA21_9GAMM|nr:hypothetical protein BOW52_04060 [Solemya elarraichensis gill symbiont]
MRFIRFTSFLIALISMQAHADILRCFTLVETGELIGGSSYYERFDGNPQRAEIEFNLKERYLVNHLGK